MLDAGFDISTATVDVSSRESVHQLVETATSFGDVTADQDAALATTPTDELLELPMLRPDQVTDLLNAYQLAERGNSMRVMAEAIRWGKRGARINTISPGIIFTPLIHDTSPVPWHHGLLTLDR
jgi:NAD(P)-dependent dehydrogenase (short-subunit alcohol dehydrogenase family)